MRIYLASIYLTIASLALGVAIGITLHDLYMVAFTGWVF